MSRWERWVKQRSGKAATQSKAMAEFTARQVTVPEPIFAELSDGLTAASTAANSGNLSSALDIFAQLRAQYPELEPRRSPACWRPNEHGSVR